MSAAVSLYGLTFRVPDGLAISYDLRAHSLAASLTNVRARRWRPGRVSLVAQVDLPTAAGWVWLHGRFMQSDALVHNFGTAAPEDYEGTWIRRAARRLVYTSSE